MMVWLGDGHHSGKYGIFLDKAFIVRSEESWEQNMITKNVILFHTFLFIFQYHDWVDTGHGGIRSCSTASIILRISNSVSWMMHLCELCVREDSCSFLRKRKKEKYFGQSVTRSIETHGFGNTHTHRPIRHVGSSSILVPSFLVWKRGREGKRDKATYINTLLPRKRFHSRWVKGINNDCLFSNNVT